jgi:hypothetical protein
VGLSDFFPRRRRRRSESALPAGYSVSSDPAEVGSTSGDAGAAQVPDDLRVNFKLKGAEGTDMAAIGEMIQTAFEQGNVEVSEGQSQVIDLRGSGLREQILEAMREHGVDAEAGSGQTIDAGAVPGLQEAILKALAQHGVDPQQPGGASPGAEGTGGQEPPPGDSSSA